MALAGCLRLVVHAVTGFTNKSLRGLVAGLLGSDHTASQMSYDLRRLRLHGLISRVAGSNPYVVTPDGARVAVFYTKLDDRLPGPLLHRPRSSRDSCLKTCHKVQRLEHQEVLEVSP